MSWDHLLSAQRLRATMENKPQTHLRSRFEQDYDRIIFSHPFRSLQDKTQVFPLPEDDFVHNRLTHSLEVSSVGRSLGRTVGEEVLKKNPSLQESGVTPHDFGAIVAAACLAHDIGNPPFGHAGESTISSFFKDSKEGQLFKGLVTPEEWLDLTNFEGNAQGFRLLNDPDNKGLKCTAATLATFTKYPKSSHSERIKGRKSQKKFGYYQSNLSDFQETAALTQLSSLGDNRWCRHPLAFLVEAADDICYLIIDLEDATRLGLVPFDETKKLLARVIGDRFDAKKLNALGDTEQKLATLRALAIHQLIIDCSQLFIEKEAEILSGDFDASLTDQLEYADTIQEITRLSIEKIYQSRQVIQREAMGLAVLKNLLTHFTHATYFIVFEPSRQMAIHKTHFQLLPESTKTKLKRENITVYQGLRWVLDFVSGMTDRSALKMHKLLTGQVSVS